MGSVPLLIADGTMGHVVTASSKVDAIPLENAAECSSLGTVGPCAAVSSADPGFDLRASSNPIIQGIRNGLYVTKRYRSQTD